MWEFLNSHSSCHDHTCLEDEEAIVGEIHALGHEEVGDVSVAAGGIVHVVLGAVVAESHPGDDELGPRYHLILLIVLKADAVIEAPQ